METITILSLHVGVPREISGDGAAPWNTSFLKSEIQGPVWLGTENLAGDRQADRRVHGGPDKAVCVYPAAHYPVWRAELGLATLADGGFGENFTVGGACEADVCIGDVYRIGAAIVAVSQPRTPCWKISRRWGCAELTARVRDTGRSGWYLRVMQEGFVAAGQFMELVERPFPRWTVAEANRLMARDRGEAAATLAQCPALAAGWRERLRVRVEDAQSRPQMPERE